MLKLTFKQLVLTGFLATTIGVFTLGIFSYLSINELQDNEKMVAQTERIISLSNKLHEQLLEAESAQRGYVLTSESEFLNLYALSVNPINTTLSNLVDLIATNPDQAENIDSLNFYVAQKKFAMQAILDAHKKGGSVASLAILKTNRAIIAMQKVRSYIGQVKRIEDKLLLQRKAVTDKSVTRAIYISVGGIFIILCLVSFLYTLIRRTFEQQKEIEQKVLSANEQLEKVSEENRKKNWMLTGSFVVDEAMRGMQDVEVRAKSVIVELAKYVNAEAGVIYLANESGQTLQLEGSYAFKNTKGLKAFSLGEGLIGQAALEKQRIIFRDVPEDYITITSGLGKTAPKCILIQPFVFQDQLKGVVELAFTEEISETVLEFIDNVIDSIAVGINASQGRVKMQMLFEQTQQQAEELETQHEELRATNEELIRKTQLLQVSEEELMVQQEELKQTNAEIEEKAQLLEER
ncbi:MAG: CHASE3 domain-containing protein, partial [Sphingobacteriaceae bacterium]